MTGTYSQYTVVIADLYGVDDMNVKSTSKTDFYTKYKTFFKMYMTWTYSQYTVVIAGRE